MSTPFNPQQGLIVVEAEAEGPAGILLLQMALDTGAGGTLINGQALAYLGYNPALASNLVQILTASGTASVPRITLSRFKALRQERLAFPVLCHALPPGLAVDGLLGLDFLRGLVLTVDFPNGLISLT